METETACLVQSTRQGRHKTMQKGLVSYFIILVQTFNLCIHCSKLFFFWSNFEHQSQKGQQLQECYGYNKRMEMKSSSGRKFLIGTDCLKLEEMFLILIR